jgi:hypothetical protein
MSKSRGAYRDSCGCFATIAGDSQMATKEEGKAQEEKDIPTGKGASHHKEKVETYQEWRNSVNVLLEDPTLRAIYKKEVFKKKK